MYLYIIRTYYLHRSLIWVEWLKVILCNQLILKKENTTATCTRLKKILSQIKLAKTLTGTCTGSFKYPPTFPFEISTSVLANCDTYIIRKRSNQIGWTILAWSYFVFMHVYQSRFFFNILFELFLFFYVSAEVSLLLL